MFRLQLQRIRYPLRPAGPSFGHPSGNSVIARALSTTGNNSKPPHAFQHALARLEQIRQTALKIASNAHAKERKHKGHFDSQQRARSFNSHQTLQADKSHINFQNSNTAVSNQKESVPISATALSSSTSKNSRYVEKRTSSDGTIYQGQWVNDLMNGDMKITFPDGKIFTGKFHLNTLVPGSGSFVHSHTSTLSVSTRRKHASFGPATDESVDRAALRTSVSLLGQAFEGVQHGSGVGLQRYPEGSVYEGETREEKFHGQGTLTCPDGSSYSGHWAHDQRTLHGVATSTDGTVYSGEWAHDSILGKGEIVYKSGDRLTGDFVFGVLYKGTGTIHGTDSVYVGDWDYGCMHGSGEYTKTNGFAYTGEWKYGLRDGEGKQVYSDGSVYTGTFLQDVYHGSGKVVCADGATVEGTFAHGELCGKGVRILADSTVHRGIFQGDSMKGEIYYPDGEKFTGVVRALLPYSGKGTVRTANTTYTGEVERGEKHGSGAFVFPDGRVYQGMWQRGLMHGEGVLRCSAGSARGEWREGQVYTAEGVMTDERGTVYEGKWENGVRTGPFKITFPSGVTLQTHGADGDEVFRKPRSKNNNTSSSEARKGPSNDLGTNDATADTTSSPDSEEVYTGDKKDGIPHGRGKLVRNGESWEGTFVHGEFTGVGIYRSIFSTSYNTGNYTTASGWGGKMISNSTSSNKVGIDKRGTVYVGHFANFTFCGKGKLHTDGKIYEGTFLENRLHGYGKCIDEIGIYEGEWAQGRRHGAGTLVQEGGNSIVDGVWFNNMLQRTASRPFVK